MWLNPAERITIMQIDERHGTANPAGSPKLVETSPQKGFKREDFYRDLKNDEPDSQWEGFKDTLKKIAAVPKEEVDEMRASREREKKRAE